MAEAVGNIVILYGDVVAETAEGERVLSQGDPVFRGETISTGEDSAVEVRFADDTTLTQTENSRISIDTYVYDPDTGAGDVLLKMTEGTFRTVTGKIVDQNPDKFKLQSPLATIGIRGTTEGSFVSGPNNPVPPDAAPETHGLLNFDGKPLVVQGVAGGPPAVFTQNGQAAGIGGGGVMAGQGFFSPSQMALFDSMSSEAMGQGPPDFTAQPGAAFGAPPLPDPPEPPDQGDGQGDDGDDLPQGDDGPQPEAGPDQGPGEEGQDEGAGDDTGDGSPVDGAPGGEGELPEGAPVDGPDPEGGESPTGGVFGAGTGVFGQGGQSLGGLFGPEGAGVPGEGGTGGLGLGDTGGFGETIGAGAAGVAGAPVGGASLPGVPGGSPTNTGGDDTGDDVIIDEEENQEDEPTQAASDGDDTTQDSGGGEDTTRVDLHFGVFYDGEDLDASGLDIPGSTGDRVYVNLAANTIDYEGTPLPSPNQESIPDSIADVRGSSGNDSLWGDDLDNDFDGAGGDDHIYGNDGSDHLYGDTGSDEIYGHAGIDYIAGGDGDDFLYGGIEGDSISGGLGDDHIEGQDGNDSLYGGDGADELYGNAGIDHLYGGAGNDEFKMDTAPDVSNYEYIGDFNTTDDSLWVDKTAFSFTNTATGTLDASRFVSDTAANIGTTNTTQADSFYFVNDSGSQALYYDADGDFSAGAKLVAYFSADVDGTFSEADISIY